MSSTLFFLVSRFLLFRAAHLIKDSFSRRVEEANQALATTYSEARKAMTVQDNENSFSTVIEELRRDLDTLKKG